MWREKKNTRTFALAAITFRVKQGGGDRPVAGVWAGHWYATVMSCDAISDTSSRSCGPKGRNPSPLIEVHVRYICTQLKFTPGRTKQKKVK